MRTYNVILNGKSYAIVRHNDGTFELPDELASLRCLETALKPAWEPILFFRKPLDGTVAANFMRWGTGGFNVDGCRVGSGKRVPGSPKRAAASTHTVSLPGYDGGSGHDPTVARWPPNVILDESQAAALDAQSGIRPSGIAVTRNGGGRRIFNGTNTDAAPQPDSGYSDTGGASRFFFCAKASTAEREMGLAHLPPRSAGELTGRKDDTDGLKSPRAGSGRASSGRRNTHPTVKPVELMRWLVRLVTPPGGVVLDPFAGSGTTGIATMLEGDGRRFVGFDLDPYHVEIARARIAHVIGGGYERAVETEVQEERQPSLFGGAA